jgi:hypothetical protein
LARREVRFGDRVRAIYGPVQQWSDRLATVDPEQLLDQQLLLSCRELTLLQTSEYASGDASVELIALGNTTIDGRAFTAAAERLSYAQAKDLLVLEGTPQSPARIRYQDPQQGKSSEQVAGKLQYYPKSQRLMLQDVQMFNFRIRK